MEAGGRGSTARGMIKTEDGEIILTVYPTDNLNKLRRIKVSYSYQYLQSFRKY